MHKMFNYTCLNPIAGVGLDLFSDDYKKVDDLAGADAALVRSAAMHDLDLPDSLLAVARAGAGVNNIPLDKCADKGIVVFNTPGANANGVKELVFAGMLYASRDIVGGIDWCLANQNDENIAKTAEKHRGMKRSLETKINLAIANKNNKRKYKNKLTGEFEILKTSDISDFSNYEKIPFKLYKNSEDSIKGIYNGDKIPKGFTLFSEQEY
jgi:hypothetical protein